MSTVPEWRALAQAAQAEDRRADALAAWRELLWLRPDDLEAIMGLAACGDIKGAIEKAQAVLRQNPDHARAAYCLGLLWLELAEWDKAEAMLARAPDDEDTAAALARVAARDVQPAYARHLFNDYAPRFEEALARLGYQAPQLLAALLQNDLGQGQRIIDLGCGTGLMAPYLKPHAAHLCGVDIAEGMLEQAARRGLYDELICGDMVAALTGRWDIMVAADAVVYMGDLAPLFAAARAAGGVLVLSAEVNGLAEGYILQDSKRHAHSPAYLQACAARAGFTDISLTPAVLRRDRGQDIQGVLLRAR